MKRVFWILIFVGMSVRLAVAGNYPYLKVSDPSYLKFYINSRECNIDHEEIEVTIDNVFRKLRIRPVEGTASIGEIDYSVEIRCDVDNLRPKPYLILTYFGTRTEDLGFVALDTFFSGQGSTRNKATILKRLKYITEKQARLFLSEN